MEISKDILVQYSDMREEAKDLRKRIEKAERTIAKIEEEGMVSDSVKGTRRDGTIGHIKITGFPIPEYSRVKNMVKGKIQKLKIIEEELLEALNAVDDYINGMPKSELRIMFRLYYIDDLTWPRVAMRMNEMFPKREIKYTDENCRKKHDRFLERE
ncbi:hypothetical protein [Robinsoniella peoriensis]|uniref:hypothetical protein n=1 Tax=Robinsoniella peoriensis TaxID=180332 RepID=UPI00363875FD